MSHMSTSADALADIVRAIKPGQLTDPTPCAEFDVRELVHHLLYWGPSLEGAARKENVPPSDVETADWRGALLAQLTRTVAAWAPASAWEGTTSMGPARVVGEMVVGELVVHAWDLARATGQSLDLPADLLAYVYDGVAAGADQGREMGLYGPAVPVPPDAPVLDRILGLTGRDPAWVGAAAPSAAR
ncbi:TIGR03086 family metal-binding protein [Actinophytocola glycyrrhizae]|uniref:TIGR03086 family metal-binding protein n=1 Tax=Actinophytocola glycyrrhizae TaxID=2044873 RepID=A0ABV9SBH8_9PSEU